MRISDWSSDVCSSDLDHADIGLFAADRGNVARALERARQTLGVVDVHLAAEGAHLVGAWAAIEALRGDGRRDERRDTGEGGHDACHSTIRRGRHRQRMRRRMRAADSAVRSEEHTSELQSLMRISYAVFCLKKKKKRRRH